MDAPPTIDPAVAHSLGDVVHWLTSETRDERFIDNIFAERLRAVPAPSA
jgi:adenylate cyclase